MSIQRVLVVDDDSLSRDFLTEAVRTLGYEADAVPSGEAAIERLSSREYHLVLTDLRMPGIGGTELVERVGRDFGDVPVVVITAHGSVETAVDAMRKGAADFLMKPCSPDTIELVLKRIDRTHRLERENAYLRQQFASATDESVIASSRGMKDTLEMAQRVAASKGTVLVTGESGTGKERVAQFIHSKSTRATGPFIRVNCAALSETLLESELFGHEKGAFTGAHKRRQGRFELADGGTLLLDEIGEVSSALQTKLLRVLEEEEFERVGGTTTLKVNVRVIATTNRDLAAEVEAGRFREDLYYRLHVLPIHLAPLRERSEDILPLAEHFAERYASQNGRPTPGFSDEAMDRLVAWNWPGNVRELENVIQRAVVLLRDDEIRGEDLSLAQKENTNPFERRPTAQSVSIWTVSAENPLADHNLREIERFAILSTIESSGGNKTEAARRLGVTARTLSNKMKLWRSLGYVA
ncbi:MAG: sigma-54 dependent transcriptional regulator [Planctomycetota bacterium]